MRMVERRKDLCFALEARQTVRILCEPVGQDFDRHLAPELRIAGAVDLAHPARAKGGQDLMRAETRTGGQGHVLRLILAMQPLTAKKQSAAVQRVIQLFAETASRSASA